MTGDGLNNLALVGALIFCVGINRVWGKKIRVANLLPAIVLAVAAAFLPGYRDIRKDVPFYTHIHPVQY